MSNVVIYILYIHIYLFVCLFVKLQLIQHITICTAIYLVNKYIRDKWYKYRWQSYITKQNKNSSYVLYCIKQLNDNISYI